MKIALITDEDRSCKRKVAKFNFNEEDDNKLRNNSKIVRNK
jgi:hypothetical protein